MGRQGGKEPTEIMKEVFGRKYETGGVRLLNPGESARDRINGSRPADRTKGANELARERMNV